jgi:excisionase family DNA binding protein
VAGEELVTIADVMLTDKLSRGTAREAIREGRLRVRRLGPRTVRIKKGDLGAWIAATGQEAAW